MPIVVNAGKDIITNRLKGSGTEPNFVAMGTGGTAEAATQTALVTEVDSSPSRPAGTSTRVTTTTANDTYQVVGTITATTARAITEAGLFDAVTAGNMFMRALFSVINLATGDSIQFTMKVQFT
jgi:hypothetical protein